MPLFYLRQQPCAYLRRQSGRRSSADLLYLICHWQCRRLSLESGSRVSSDFLSSLKDADKILCWRAILVCYMVSLGQQIPREMQLRPVLSDNQGFDCLIAVGSDLGLTLERLLRYY